MVSRRAIRSTRARRCVFQSEAALQLSLEQLDAVRDERFPYAFVRREVPVGGCIPDLVMVRFAEAPSVGAWPARPTFRHALAVWLLRRHGGRLHLETIASKAFEAPDAMDRALADLLTTGALRKSNTGAFYLTPSFARIAVEVIAVEAKLRRWRDAIEQAAQYARFADQALVAMDIGGAPRSPKVLFEFRQRGIGLLAAGRRTFEWLVPPRRNSHRLGPERDYLVASAVASRSQTLWYRR